ncbi:hypothetical protein ACFQ21_14740 [Ohtaekwangia kribbensis]|jgi:hypothetical protein|uniref:Uncharacterized protein n=1 Tax=Ohtaekwangia kribbensis TaxID=688913 RepID=A0ABW3K3I9_9BACT
MKVIKVSFLLCVCLVGVVKAQNDSTLNDDLFEYPIKIQKGQEQHYLKYALTLVKQDSAIKAYQILYRLGNTAQHGENSKEINIANKKIKQKITKQSNGFLRGKWKLDYEGHCNYPRCIDSTKIEEVIISKRKIRFYEKGKPVRIYKYTYRIQVDPHFGYIHYIVIYKNYFEGWIYEIIRDSKGRKRLHVTRDNGMNHGYFAEYVKSE